MTTLTSSPTKVILNKKMRGSGTFTASNEIVGLRKITSRNLKNFKKTRDRAEIGLNSSE